MRLVHLADLHIGFRQYQRQTPAGINQREADVAAAFTKAVDQIIARAPDVVIIAGDVFHQVRPANPAILHAFSQMARLVRALPDAIVIMIAGNHDTPRSRDTVCILRLFSQLGVHVVEASPKTLRFPEKSLSVLCLPSSTEPDIDIAPDPTSRYNVLTLHGEPRGFFPEHDQERAQLIVSMEDLTRPEWDYVAMGHYHVYRHVGAKAWYSGSLEYTSPNAWSELREEREKKLPGKGMIEFDLEHGKHTFIPLKASRVLVDLPAIDGRGLGATELNARIEAVVARCKGGIEDKVVRLMLRDVPRHVARDLDHRALREYRRAALHFNLDVRPPELTRRVASGAPGRPVTLAETLRERLQSRPLDAELDRERFVATGLEYLARIDAGAEATRVEGDPQ